MLKHRSQALCACFLVTDLLLTGAAWLGAYYLRFEAGWLPLTKSTPDSELCWRNLPLVILLSAVAYHYTGQYVIHRLRRFREDMVAVVKGTMLLSLLVMATMFYTQDPYESRATMLLFSSLTATSMLTARGIGWHIIRRLRSRGFNQTLRHHRRHRPGRAEDRPGACGTPTGWASRISASSRTAPPTGPATWTCSAPSPTCRTWSSATRSITSSSPCRLSRYHDARRVFDVLSRSMVEVRLVADVPNLAGLSLTTANLDGLPVIGLRESPHFGLNVVVKRAMDIVLSLVALMVLCRR